MYRGVIERYRNYIPINSDKIITLYEGNTPLIRAKNIERNFGIKAMIYLKCEGFNPTGSFKDRGMTVAITKAVSDGVKSVICASTGNTSASAASYSARAGLKCFVVIPKGYVAHGKLSQAVAHGARIIEIKANFDAALQVVRDISSILNVTIVNSVNPYRLEGQKTAAFEIIDELGDAPDYLFIPVGNAGNISAYWMGFTEWFNLKKSTKRPRMMGFEAMGAAPIYYNKKIENPETIATAIRIGNPASWDKALKARDESGGQIEVVSDDEIIEAYKILASYEGIFAEPASAAGLAGLLKFKDRIRGIAVCVITGHGLKDPEFPQRFLQSLEFEPDTSKIVDFISKEI